jgi:uncharacterized membrane protein HdeD (DUF308 family)
MDSIIERAGQKTNAQLTKVRLALGINGVLSIAFGVVILVWPGLSLFALTILFGAYTAATGVVGLVAAISGTVKESRGWLAISSLLGIVVGITVLVWTGIGALALLYVIGAYAVALGIISVGGAFWLPIDGGDSALLVVSGLVSILFGIVIFARPGDGALVLLALIAAFALVTGISQLVFGIGGKRLLESEVRRLSRRPEPQTSH